MGNYGSLLFYQNKRVYVMGMESVEVRVARLEENMKFLVNESIEAKAARKAQYTTMEEMKESVHSMAGEVTTVKDKLATASPTIEEFITIKHKIVGAGKLGKWLWTIGAALIGYAYASREAIGHWLTKI